MKTQSSWESPLKCSGCERRLQLSHGVHWDGSGRIVMICQASGFTPSEFRKLPPMADMDIEDAIAYCRRIDGGKGNEG